MLSISTERYDYRDLLRIQTDKIRLCSITNLPCGIKKMSLCWFIPQQDGAAHIDDRDRQNDYSPVENSERIG